MLDSGENEGMGNDAFRKLLNEFNATYTYNEKFKEYVDSNYSYTIDLYGAKTFRVDDMKEAKKFWKQNQKKHPNYPWFNEVYEAYEWIDNMPISGYEY